MAVSLLLILPLGGFAADSNQRSPEPISALKWTNAPWSGPNFFPIAVWLQAPANAKRYRQAGINTYYRVI